MSNSAKKARNFAALSGGALVAASPFVVSGTAQADTITVSNTDDSGPGSLRQAIIDANGNAVADTITITATGTITLLSQLPKVHGSAVIDGPGAASLTIDGDDSYGVFYLYNGGGGEVTISDLTIANANRNYGAGIYTYNIDLTLDGVVIRDSHSDIYGAGVYFTSDGLYGDLTVIDSTISGNTAQYGAGIYVANTASNADVVIQDSVFSENSVTGGAGALYIGNDYPISLLIQGSTFSDNTSDQIGGAITLYLGDEASTTIQNSTFSGNEAGGSGGALYMGDVAGELIIESSTLSGNTSGSCGGAQYIATVTGDISIVNSTFSGNTALYGGGIYVEGLYDTAGSVTISHTTITGNSATAIDERYNGGGGIYLGNIGFDAPGYVVLDHTVIAGNTAVLPGDDISVGEGGGFTGSYSMVGNLDGFTLGGTTNLPAGDPMLGALADNGGDTETHLPQAGSPLINAGDPAYPTVLPTSAAVLTDQRGLTRVAGGRIDIGAVEVQSAVLPPTGGSNGLMAGLGAALLGLGGALHLTGRRKRSA